MTELTPVIATIVGLVPADQHDGVVLALKVELALIVEELGIKGRVRVITDPLMRLPVWETTP